jgi:hypothetical protein
MNFKSWLVISEMARSFSPKYLEKNSLQALSETASDPVLKARYKILVSEWDTENNILTPSDVTIGSKKKINWKCLEKRHKWAATLNSRTIGGNNCFYCSLQKIQKTSSKRLEDLAYYFGRNGSGPWQYDSNKENKSLARWLYDKKQTNPNPNPHEESDKTWADMVKLSKTPNWIDPVTKNPFLYKNLPNDWRNIETKIGSKTSSENFKELAYYFGRNGLGPSKYASDEVNKSLGQWHVDKKSRKINPNEALDNKIWADMVELSKDPNWIDPDTRERFNFSPLPDNWRNIEANKRQEKGKRNSSKNFKELAYYFGRNGSGPSQHDSNPYLGRWHNGKKNRPNPYEKLDDIIWAEIVALSKNWNNKKFPYDLPDDWRDIEPDQSNFSIPAKELGKILNKYFDDIIREYPDKECNITTGQCFKFDYSFIYDDQEYFVEYHGEQHYYPVNFGSKEVKTKQEIAKDVLDKFLYNQENDRKKYNYCKNKNFPLLVIPYWKKIDEFEEIVLSFIKHGNVFDTLFAKPDVPQKNKEYHDRKYAEFLAKSKSTELVETKTFEQFLINKNFINI